MKEISPWTAKRVDLLRTEWAKGTTASRIAAILGGTTRNAVIGKASRLGLNGRPSPIIANDKTDEKRKASAGAKMKAPESPLKAWARNFWTSERDEILRKGFTTSGYRTAKDLAAEFKCSDTAVAKRAQALGLRNPYKFARRALSPGATERAVKAKASIDRAVPIMAPSSGDFALSDLPSRGCQFATSPHNARDHRFCGAKVEATSDRPPYCDFHQQIVFRPMYEHGAEPVKVAAE